MKVIKGICNGIDKFNDILGRVFSVLVLGIIGATVSATAIALSAVGMAKVRRANKN